MRTVVITVLCVAIVATTAFAQEGGHIGLYSDSPGFSDCNLTEVPFTTNTIYVVHQQAIRADWSRFMVSHNWSGAVAGTVDYGLGYIVSGNIYTGIELHYPGCQSLPYLVASLAFIPLGPTPPCTVFFEVVADPRVASGEIVSSTCGISPTVATGGRLIVNGDYNDCNCAVAIEEATWSRVKALYQ